MPWTSDTTAMIDVTATILPSTVRNDRSLFDHIALSAIDAASKNWFTALVGVLSVAVGLDRRAIRELADRRERSGDDDVAFFWARQHLEILFAGHAGFDRHEQCFAVLHGKDPFELLLRLARLELGGVQPGAGAGASALVGVGRPDDVALVVEHDFANGGRLDRHRDGVCRAPRW